MGIGTLSIALLPSYATAGLWGAFGLLIARILQGFGMGGEFLGASLFLMEHQPDRPCLASSWISAAAALGMVVGALVAYLCSRCAAVEWIWRLPFLVGALGCWVSFKLRVWVQDTLPAANRQPRVALFRSVALLWKHYRFGFLKVMVLSGFTGVLVYTFNVYFLVFLRQQAGLSLSLATWLTTLSQLAVCFGILIFGRLVDKHPIRFYRAGLGITLLVSPLIFYLSSTGQFSLILFSLALYVSSNALTSACVFKLAFDVFPIHLRYLGMATAWSLSAAIFSGTAPLLATWLSAYTDYWGQAIYVQLMTLLALCFVSVENNKRPIQ